MEQAELERRIAGVSRTVLSFCIARTATREDAEDLAQEILCEIVRSSVNLRDDGAFYGFMWSIARHVTARWYERRACPTAELTASVAETVAEASEDDGTDIALLRRELSLLSSKYRRATVLYYMRGMGCAAIAHKLSLSESMVKYLLFKSRNILREGIKMTRNYGKQSYEPRRLTLCYMGEGPNRFWSLTNGNLIRQNILWACASDTLSEQDIALEIGVSLPYIEEDIRILTEAGLLMRQGKLYRTGVILLTEDYAREKAPAIRDTLDAIAASVAAYVRESAACVRALGFSGADMSLPSLRWQMAMILLRVPYADAWRAWLGEQECPRTAFGERAYVWGTELSGGQFNQCTVSEGDFSLCFLDAPAYCTGWHGDFFGHPKRVALLSRIAAGAEYLREAEEETAAELIRLGYLYKDGERLRSAIPIYTGAQYDALHSLMAETQQSLQTGMCRLCEQSAAVLKNHAPTALRAQVNAIAAMDLFSDVTDGVISRLLNSGALTQPTAPNEIPGAWGVLG